MRTSSRLCCILTLLVATQAMPAEDQTWLELHAPGFRMVSQLNTRLTRQRAQDFDRFITSLQQLHAIDGAQLPPLTIVLFEHELAFAPYRTHTASGQSQSVSGFFGDAGFWSVIGMYGRNDSEATRRTIYHEATHWLLSSSQVDDPLWFKEGIAEIYSTFRLNKGRVEWGLPIEDHIARLNAAGLQPLGEFLRATQGDALHELDTYYPQAWAFVHFLMYGEGGSRRRQLQDFREKLGTLPLEAAFESAFSMSYAEMNEALSLYLHSEAFNFEQGAAPPDAPDAHMLIEDASPGSVDFALGRLAVIGGNGEIARMHGQNLVTQLAGRPEGYEILAHSHAGGADTAALTEALDQAIALGSTDGRVFLLKAHALFNANLKTDAEWPDAALPPDVARQAADHYAQSLRTGPLLTSNVLASTMHSLVRALLSVTTTTPRDAELLNQLAALFPTDGTPLLGKALLAHLAGDEQEANVLLTAANTEPRRMPLDLQQAAHALQQRWFIDWMRATIDGLVAEQRFADAGAWLDAQALDGNLTAEQRAVLDAYRAEMAGYGAIASAQALIKSGQIEEARKSLRTIANDSANSSNVKVAARRLLIFLNR